MKGMDGGACVLCARFSSTDQLLSMYRQTVLNRRSTSGSVVSVEASDSCKSEVLVAYCAQNISDSFPKKKPGPGAVKTRLPLGAMAEHCVMSSPTPRAEAFW